MAHLFQRLLDVYLLLKQNTIVFIHTESTSDCLFMLYTFSAFNVSASDMSEF
jgi:hypothetical protein